MMSSLNDSVVIVNHFCYKCQKVVDILTAEETCGRCGTGFIEEILGTPLKESRKKGSHVTDEINECLKETPEKSSKESPEKTECCICLQTMDSTTEMIVKLVCQHTFHKECVKNWFQRANNCPLCRGKVDVPSVVTPVSRVNAMRSQSVRSRSPITNRRHHLQTSHLNMNGREIRNFLRGLENRGLPIQQSAQLRQYYRNILASPTRAGSEQEFAWIFPPDFGQPSSSSGTSN